MVSYNVTYIKEDTKKVYTELDCSINKLREENGKLLFIYNDYYKSNEVISCIPVRSITSEEVTMNGRFGCE